MQGVGFRRSCAEQAWAIGVAGWVANRAGHVEVHAEGRADRVEELLRWCRVGPRMAQVDSMRTSPAALEGLSEFRIR